MKMETKTKNIGLRSERGGGGEGVHWNDDFGASDLWEPGGGKDGRPPCGPNSFM